MKRTLSKLLGIAALAIAGIAGSFIATSPAQAQAVTCIDYTGNGVYPTSGNFFICFPAAAPVDPARRNAIINTVQGLPRRTGTTAPLLVRDVLKAANHKYHYFLDRTSYNTYIANTAPYSSAINKFQDLTARCGTTRADAATGIEITAIFEFCTVAGGTYQNPELERATLHESGHAYAISHAKIIKGNIAQPIDVGSGWKTLMQHDIVNLTPSNWAAKSASQKAAYICGIFGNIPLSVLEVDFLGTPTGPVCNASGVLDSAYVGMTPRQVYESKFPYFVKNTAATGAPINGSNLELFAQLFVIRHASIDPTQMDFLKQTDQALGYGSYNTAGAAFRCTKIAMQAFYLTPATAPSSTLLLNAMCPNPSSY